jgi:hypothetical protein
MTRTVNVFISSILYDFIALHVDKDSDWGKIEKREKEREVMSV